MSAKIKRLSIGVERKHPVTMHKASLMGLSIKRVQALLPKVLFILKKEVKDILRQKKECFLKKKGRGQWTNVF